MSLGPIYIDAGLFANFFVRDAHLVIRDLFAIFGWAIFAYFLIYAGIVLYLFYRQIVHTAKWKWVLLAVDIPELNVQTPKAVEQLFAHLAGAFHHPDISAKFIDGYKQKWFSFEIISIEGYIQFLIRTEETLRDLVEASVYAQYPDAEITEVEDYVNGVPGRFPDEKYDAWAADFTLTEHIAYPIRTYREFEHMITKDTTGAVLKDPMSAFLESFSRIGPGEQMWFQIIIEPVSNSWKEKVIAKIKEMLGESVGEKGLIYSLTGGLVSAEMKKSFGELRTQVLGESRSEGEPEASESKLASLTPGQTKLLEAMEGKMGKIGFSTKMRGAYIARKEVFKPDRGVQALVGAINQFNVPTANSLAPTYTTRVSYLFKQWRSDWRKTLLLQAYKKRKIKAGKSPFILNIEELATVWHFPMSHVKTPLLQKAGAKKAEPPSGLPIEPSAPFFPEKAPVEEKPKPIYRTDSGHVLISDQDELR